MKAVQDCQTHELLKALENLREMEARVQRAIRNDLAGKQHLALHDVYGTRVLGQRVINALMALESDIQASIERETSPTTRPPA